MENEKELNTKWKPNGTYDSKIDQKGSKTKKKVSPVFAPSFEKKTMTDKDKVKKDYAIADTWNQILNGQLKADAVESAKKTRSKALVDRFK